MRSARVQRLRTPFPYARAFAVIHRCPLLTRVVPLCSSFTLAGLDRAGQRRVCVMLMHVDANYVARTAAYCSSFGSTLRVATIVRPPRPASKRCFLSSHETNSLDARPMAPAIVPARILRTRLVGPCFLSSYIQRTLNDFILPPSIAGTWLSPTDQLLTRFVGIENEEGLLCGATGR